MRRDLFLIVLELPTRFVSDRVGVAVGCMRELGGKSGLPPYSQLILAKFLSVACVKCEG